MFSPIVAIASTISSRTEPVGVAERLVEQADVLEPLLELAVDDLLADRLGLLLDRLVGEKRGLRSGQDLGRDRVGVDVLRMHPGDLDGQVPDELLELVGAGDEVGLAVDLDQDADPATGVDVAADRGPRGPRGRPSWRPPPGRAHGAATTALSTSPPVSSSARLQSMKPAPVSSRSSLTALAEMSAIPEPAPVPLFSDHPGRTRPMSCSPICWAAIAARRADRGPSVSGRCVTTRRLGDRCAGTSSVSAFSLASRASSAAISSGVASAGGSGIAAAAAAGAADGRQEVVLVGREDQGRSAGQGRDELVGGRLGLLGRDVGLLDLGLRLDGGPRGALAHAFDRGIGNHRAQQPDRPDRVVVGGHDVGQLVRVDVRVARPDQRDLELVGLGHGDPLTMRVDDEDQARQALHLADAAERPGQLGQLLLELGRFLLRPSARSRRSADEPRAAPSGRSAS